MASRKNNQERKKAKRAAKRKAKRKAGLRATGFPSDTPLLVELPGSFKMSDGLKELVAPYWETCQTPEALDEMLTMGMVAWNAALLTGNEREQMIQDMLKVLPADTHADARRILTSLIRRKEQLFPTVTRMMVSYELIPSPA